VTKNIKTGEVFTPIEWGRFAVREAGILERWLNGAIVFDCCMGSGNLFLALISEALDKGFSLDRLPLQNIYGTELYQHNIDAWFKTAEEMQLPVKRENFVRADFCFTKPFIKADILLTNPPWISFGNLEANYKEQLKPLFQQYGLIEPNNKILLGKSRVDLSALIITIAGADWLKDDALIAAFLPSSLFSSMVHEQFRDFDKNMKTSLNKIYHLTNRKVFNVNCLYLFAIFDKPQKPKASALQYTWCKEKQCWETSPFHHQHATVKDFSLFSYKKTNTPRQGVNTGGANALFIFDKAVFKDKSVEVSNKSNSAVLPRQYLYPLLSPQNFRGEDSALRWVLLPYTKNGKLLDYAEIKKNKLLYNYFSQNETSLRARKGALLANYTKGEKFYALLGVGPYSFAPYKIIWQAMGAKQFVPKIFDGRWQANQAMHSFIPAYSKEEAEKLFNYLTSTEVCRYVEKRYGVGHQSFAQPHVIKELFIWHH
jgi:hypothetical protein